MQIGALIPNKIMTNCKNCNVEVGKKTIEGCWKDEHTPDHIGLCCDCFDVLLGAEPPNKVRTRNED